MRKAVAYAFNTGEQLMKVGCAVVHFKSELRNAKLEARHAARRITYATEDFLDEVTIAIKRNPMTSVAVAFGVALPIGALAAWMVARPGATTKT